VDQGQYAGGQGVSQPAITIYTMQWCGYCRRAKQLLQDRNLVFTEIDIDGDPDLREQMLARSRQRTAPQIFIGDQHIGGCDELHALARSGELDRITRGD
jgi:glutaredoxin 3